MESTSLLTFINPQPLYPFTKPIYHHFHQTPRLPRQLPPLRLSNFIQEADHLVSASRKWSRNKGGAVIGDYYRHNGDGDEDIDDDDDDEEEDRSLDLLIKFVENVFKKVSKRARKAVRSVLPIPISTKLVGFSVNGVIILTFLWILKAFLEVVCTLGSVVFTSILVIRGVWAGISYLQETHTRNNPTWHGTQPVS